MFLTLLQEVILSLNVVKTLEEILSVVILNMVMSDKWKSFILKFIPFILVFLIGLYCGYRLMPTKTVTKVETKVETKYVEVEGKHTTEV